MPTFMIERSVPGAGAMSSKELEDISTHSVKVCEALGVPYRWITSYVAGDKIYCVHEAESADIIRRHSEQAGFPADRITPVAAQIGPQTARAMC